MAVDYAEKEREFLDGLAEDTGRDLAGWMAAIAETRLTDRNAIIDWLRQQGFLFARASWMERIYHNGGRPIYLEAPSERRPALAVPFAAAKDAPTAPPSGLRATAVPTGSAALETLLAVAKGYRPLAQLVLKEIMSIAPGAILEPRDGYVAIQNPRGALAAVLTVTARELRLGLATGDRADPAPFTKAKFPKSSPEIPAAITHMVVLTDARQITPELMTAVAQAIAPA
jgi:hypothetical protein